MEHSERKELEIFIVLAAKTYHRTANYGKVVGIFLSFRISVSAWVWCSTQVGRNRCQSALGETNRRDKEKGRPVEHLPASVLLDG